MIFSAEDDYFHLRRQRAFEALHQSGILAKPPPTITNTFEKVWRDDASCYLNLAFIFLCRFPQNEPIEDAVLIGNELY